MQAQTSTASTSFIASPNIFPTLYYIPATPQPAGQAFDQRRQVNPMHFPYMAGVMYPHPQLYQQSLMYPPMMYQAMPYQPVPPPCGLSTDPRNVSTNCSVSYPYRPPVENRQLTQLSCVYFQQQSIMTDRTKMTSAQTVHLPAGSESQSQVIFQRPPSQATSVKAEPGSNMGSIASASMVNRAFSESSKKGMADSPVISNMEEMRCKSQRDEVSDDMTESSYSSFYSSFLKTDYSSDKSDQKDHWLTAPKKRPNPQWLDNVCVTQDLIYRYQINESSVQELLEADKCALKHLNQVIIQYIKALVLRLLIIFLYL
jgi:period circadian protein